MLCELQSGDVTPADASASIVGKKLAAGPSTRRSTEESGGGPPAPNLSFLDDEQHAVTKQKPKPSRAGKASPRDAAPQPPPPQVSSSLSSNASSFPLSLSLTITHFHSPLLSFPHLLSSPLSFLFVFSSRICLTTTVTKHSGV